MFKPREAFLTVESYIDHLTAVAESSFRELATRWEGEVTILKAESAEEMDRMRAEIVDLRAEISSLRTHKCQAVSSPLGSSPGVTEGQ